MGAWVTGDDRTDLRFPRDESHTFAVTPNIVGHRVKVFGVHMPQRNADTAYGDELEAVERIHGDEEVAMHVVMGECNRHVPTHLDTRAFVATIGCTIVCKRAVGRVHKD